MKATNSGVAFSAAKMRSPSFSRSSSSMTTTALPAAISAIARSTGSSLVISTTLSAPAPEPRVIALQYEPHIDSSYCPPVVVRLGQDTKPRPKSRPAHRRHSRKWRFCAGQFGELPAESHRRPMRPLGRRALPRVETSFVRAAVRRICFEPSGRTHGVAGNGIAVRSIRCHRRPTDGRAAGLAEILPADDLAQLVDDSGKHLTGPGEARDGRRCSHAHPLPCRACRPACRRSSPHSSPSVP